MDTKEANKQDFETGSTSALTDLELTGNESEEIMGAIGGGNINVYFHVIRNTADDSNSKA